MGFSQAFWIAIFISARPKPPPMASFARPKKASSQLGKILEIKFQHANCRIALIEGVGLHLRVAENCRQLFIGHDEARKPHEVFAHFAEYPAVAVEVIHIDTAQ